MWTMPLITPHHPNATTYPPPILTVKIFTKSAIYASKTILVIILIKWIYATPDNFQIKILAELFLLKLFFRIFLVKSSSWQKNYKSQPNFLFNLIWTFQDFAFQLKIKRTFGSDL